MANADGRCDNPRCTCVPCTCGNCRCGGSQLGDLERRVMAVLWSSPEGELRGRDVADQLPEYAYTTIATVLDRLSHKGEVRRRTKGRRVQFSAVQTGASHSAKAMREALEDAVDAESALADFAASLPPDQRAALLRALERQ